MRRLLITTTLITSLAAPAALAQDPSGGLGRWLDLFDPDLLVQRALQSGILALRTQMDVTYEGMTVDLLGGTVTLSELRAWPLPEWEGGDGCEVSIDQMVIRSGPLNDPDTLRMTAQLIGAAFPTSCLPPDVRAPLTPLGITELDVPRVTLSMAYGLPGSDLSLRLHADVANQAALTVEADFAYAWFDGREDLDDPIPILFLEHAAISLENHGLWARVSPLLPPPLTGEGAGGFVQNMLTDGLTDANSGAPLSAAQQAFVSSAAQAWPAFLARPETLLIETTNASDVFLDLELIEDDPRALFDPLEPVVALRPALRAALLPAELLIAAMDAPETLSLTDRKRAGLALVTGNGAPRNIAAGATLLEGLAAQNDGESAAAMARATALTEPEAAYEWALVAGLSGQRGMTTLQSQLEARIGLARVLELQAEAVGSDALLTRALGSVSDMRSEAAMHMSGKGRKRSYERAAVWAILAAAAGDGEAADMLAQLTERASSLGPEALAAWAEAEERAATLAMQTWIEADLAARFGG